MLVLKFNDEVRKRIDPKNLEIFFDVIGDKKLHITVRWNKINFMR